MRRRRMKRLLWRSSMWSATEGGGGNSGARRRSSSVGGLLRLMALSSATPSGGLRGRLVDVLVTMLDKFQLFMSFVFWDLVQFLDRVLDIPVGYLVGDAQCTLRTGPWSSTGPGSWYGVDVPVVVQQQVPWPTLLADAWFDSGYIFCVSTWWLWKNFTHFSM